MKYKIPLPALLIYCTTFFSAGNAFCQPAPGDSFYLNALDNSMAVYHHSFSGHPSLYNGSMYYNYPFNFEEGQPYYYSSEMTIGSVLYDGVRYDSVIMQYDEIADAVIIQVMPDRIQLRSEKVQSFDLYDSHFVRMEKNENIPGMQKTGFYNLLYDGTTGVLKREIKILREETTSNAELLIFVDTKEYYYLKRKDQLFVVSSAKDFYNLLGDHKNEVKDYVKANGLSFKKDRQTMLSKATAYYDSLK